MTATAGARSCDASSICLMIGVWHGQGNDGYEDPDETAEKTRLKQASQAADIGQLDESQLRQLLALAQLLLQDVGRPDLDLSGLDAAAHQVLLSVQVCSIDTLDRLLYCLIQSK